MEAFLTVAVFEQHQKHVDIRFDNVESSLVRIENALIAQAVKQDLHVHQGYVRWPAFVTALIASVAASSAVTLGVVQLVSS